MAHVKRSYVATETDVWWVLGTRPGGKYSFAAGAEDLTSDCGTAERFATEAAAREALTLVVPAAVRPKLRVIRVSRTTRESCDG